MLSCVWRKGKVREEPPLLKKMDKSATNLETPSKTTSSAKSTKKMKEASSYQGVPMSQADVDACYESFCFMLLEDFMMKKNMKNSLEAFRAEYTRPDEVHWIFFNTSIYLIHNFPPIFPQNLRLLNW